MDVQLKRLENNIKADEELLREIYIKTDEELLREIYRNLVNDDLSSKENQKMMLMLKIKSHFEKQDKEL